MRKDCANVLKATFAVHLVAESIFGITANASPANMICEKMALAN
jgi:hypothetical protein